MSAWHYTDQNFYILYVVLGIVVVGILVNFMAIKFYFNLKRYGNDTSRLKEFKDLVFENFSFKDDSGASGVGKNQDLELGKTEKDLQSIEESTDDTAVDLHITDTEITFIDK